MKQGEVIRGYRVVTEPTGAGGARCQWAFAAKGGSEFHLKQFLMPRWPLDSTPGSAKGKAAKRERCQVFEARHNRIMKATQAVSVGGGNLIVAVAFFREGSQYYKITERVNGVAMPDPHGMSPKQRTVLLHTLMNSVEILHRHDIVHNDLKPDNLILRQTERGLYSAKLIDFDDSYFVGDPAPPEDIVADPAFYSPELLRYIKAGEDADGRSLTTASDVFALGVIFHILLTGERPRASDGATAAYPAETLLGRGSLIVDAGLSDVHRQLVAEMLDIDPANRPAAPEIIARLKSGTAADGPSGPVSTPRRLPLAPERPSASSAKVRATGFGKAKEPEPDVTGPRPAVRVGRGFKPKSS
jgi:serine/threonine protein kinase